MAAKTLEEIAKELKKMKFKSALVGGVDKKDVWKKIERLNDDFMQYIEQQRIGYEAVLAEKDRMIAGGITVNAAQILPGPVSGAMPALPMDGGMPPYGDPTMMGMPYGDPSSAPIGAPSPQGEGMYGMGAMPPMLDENGQPLMPPYTPQGMYGDLPLEGKVAAQPTDEVAYFQQPMPPMLDENGQPLMPPYGDPGMAALPPSEGMYGRMPPMPPMPGGEYAPPAGGFEPDWDSPMPPFDPNFAPPVHLTQPPQPAMDPAMMGMPYGDPSSAPTGAPSPQGEGMYSGVTSPGFDPSMPGSMQLQPSPIGEGGPIGPEGAMYGMPPMPPMLDENGQPLMPPYGDPTMMGMPFGDPSTMPPMPGMMPPPGPQIPPFGTGMG